LGQQCERYPSVLRHVVDAGMAVGVHSWSHADLVGRDLPSVTDELQRSIDVLGSLGARTTLFRPPYGSWNRSLIAAARSLGLHTITWDVPGDDWKKPGSAAIVERVLTNATHRSIVLLHDGGGDRSQTVAALPPIIGGLRAKGLDFADLSQQCW